MQAASGRVAAITGAASGIGRAVAALFASQGMAVIAADVREDLLKEAAACGGDIQIAICDTTNEASVQLLFEGIAGRYRKLDVLVTCAGISTAGLVHETTLADWDLVLRTNLTGTFLAIKHAVPLMPVHQNSAIVTVGSVAASVIASGGGAACYEASKAGVVHLTRAVAIEYADRGIRANCVSPGKITTNFPLHRDELRATTFTSKPTAFRTRPEKSPLLKEAGSPEEVANMVAFLCSEQAGFTTGANFVVDGGYCCT